MLKTSDAYPHLYHYTDWKGLTGILETQKLWASHYKFLNDSSEIILFRGQLIEFLKPYIEKKIVELERVDPEVKEIIAKEGGLSAIVQHETEVWVDSNYAAATEEIYIASFCGTHKEQYINENGLLSQWRSYGKGGGFAVVFNTKAVEEALNKEGDTFNYGFGHVSDVIYSNNKEQYEAELLPSLQAIAKYAEEFFNPVDLNQDSDFEIVKAAYAGLLTCVTRYKHQGFKEENEVRLVARLAVLKEAALQYNRENNIVPKPEKERKYREISGEKIPYIELFGISDVPLPIERIIVGPHKEKVNRAQYLRVLLRNTDIEINVSDIPYLG